VIQASIKARLERDPAYAAAAAAAAARVKKWKAANPEKVMAQHERARRAKGMKPMVRIPRVSPADSAMDRRHVAALRMIRNGQRPEMSSAQRYKAKYRANARFALQERLRNQVTKATGLYGWVGHYFGHYARARKGRAMWQALGYTVDELRGHLGRQFKGGMDWAAFDAGEIHIDHIVPKSTFSLDTQQDLRACFALSNLQPLWASDNLKKGASITRLL
jgi:hypothetical protein